MFFSHLVSVVVAAVVFVSVLSIIYPIGTREVELVELIPDDEFLSGRIFIGNTYSLKMDSTKPNDMNDSTKRSPLKIGSSLFTKQRIANKSTAKPSMNASEDVLKNPALFVLNPDGIMKRIEKVRFN